MFELLVEMVRFISHMVSILFVLGVALVIVLYIEKYIRDKREARENLVLKKLWYKQ